MGSRFFPLLFIGVMCLYCIACRSKPNKVVRSYYYWKSSDELDEPSRGLLKRAQIKKLYRKILDVDWSTTQGAVPVASAGTAYINASLNKYDSLNINIVPVIFITNKTFQQIESAAIPELALRILRRCIPDLDSLSNMSGPYYPVPSEIQFDCDWTESTSKKYFNFLQTVRSLMHRDSITISATIRLHQFKYPEKTGVPPVDRSMLMMYNISDIREHSATNSIFNEPKAAAYFNTGKPYPLPLDIALAAFSWCIVFRQGQFYQIENGLSQADLDTCRFLHKTIDGFYKVLQDTVYKDVFLRPGDEIKAETIGEKELLQAAALAHKAIDTDSFSVSLFELSEKEIKNYSDETIDKVYRSFK